MKRFQLFAFSFGLILALCLLVGCSAKTPLTAEEFTDLMEQAGYQIYDGSVENQGVMVFLPAVDPDDRFDIEFYVFYSSETAEYAFDGIKAGLKSQNGVWYMTTDIAAANYSRYSGTQNDIYYIVSRIDNTIIYVMTEAENKNEVNETLKTLGYR